MSSARKRAVETLRHYLDPATAHRAHGVPPMKRPKSVCAWVTKRPVTIYKLNKAGEVSPAGRRELDVEETTLLLPAEPSTELREVKRACAWLGDKRYLIEEENGREVIYLAPGTKLANKGKV